MLRSLVILCIVTLLYGCGPNYKTMYHYVPPHDSKALDCTEDCARKQRFCYCQCGKKLDECENGLYDPQKRDRYAHADSDRKQTALSCEQHFNNCNNECDLNFRLCYNTCGGTVVIENRCIHNCDGAEN